MPDNPPKGPDTTATITAQPAADAAGTSGAPAPGEDLRAMLATERESREKRERELHELRTAYNRRDAEVSNLRRMVAKPSGQPGYETGATLFGGTETPPAAPPEYEKLTKEMEQVKYNQGFLQFRLDHPDAQKHWTDINGILNDQAALADVASYLPGTSSPDIYRTLKNALREVENRQYLKSKDASDKAAEAAAVTRGRTRTQAHISGAAISGEEPPIDISGMSPEDMLDKGLVATDPLDPPRHLRKE